MKVSLVSFLTAAAVSSTTTNAFSVQLPSSLALRDPLSPTPTELEASRHRQKIESRTKWLEKRGLSTSGAVATGEAAAPGLMTNDEGLEYVKLVDPETKASSEVYLYGGVVTSYVDADNVEYIAVRPDAKMDGSKPISGGLSHCWPQFGPGEIQQHGFARNVNWTVKSMTDTSVELEMAPDDYTKGMWNKNFLCTFTVTLESDQLSTKMLVENKQDEAFDFQAALHSYFQVSALDKLEITGSFQGKKFLNKVSGKTETEDRSVITITEEYDRVYKGVNNPVLKDAGTGKSLAVLNTAGWEDTVVWNPYGNEGMGYNNFVCVESVKFDPVTLQAGSSWEGVMALKPSDS